MPLIPSLAIATFVLIIVISSTTATQVKALRAPSIFRRTKHIMGQAISSTQFTSMGGDISLRKYDDRGLHNSQQFSFF